MVVKEKVRTCFVLMPEVKGIWCTKLIQGVAENDLKDVVYSIVQWMHEVFCVNEMV